MKFAASIAVSLILCTAVICQDNTPEFGQYSVKVEKATAKNVNLRSHKMARMFRTSLRESLKEGVNFAGKYVVSITGCGTGCIQARIINAKNGAVYFPEPLMVMSSTFELGDADTIEFKPDSRLLIVNGYVSDGKDENGDYKVTEDFGNWYYEWTGTKLKLIRFIKKGSMSEEEDGDEQ
ncbi:MAG: hypothetical protein R2681_17895 [Pyrinomonadaceae bacterium]